MRTLGDIFRCPELDGCSITLHDINADSLKTDAARQYIGRHEVSHALSATTSRKEALLDADFCIISIEVGDRFALWEQGLANTAAVWYPTGIRRKRRPRRPHFIL